MKYRYVILFLVLLFAAAELKYFSSLRNYASFCEGYVIGDWLLNFAGGFVRRGTSGFIFLGLSDAFSIKPQYLVMCFQAAVHLTYMLLLFLLVYRKKIDIWFTILLLSPVILLFPIYDVHVSGRKEILIYLIFASYLYCINKSKYTSRKVIIPFAIVLSLATLMHELVFFYTPYFFLAAYLKAKESGEQFKWRPVFYTILGSLLVMLPIYFLGSDINEDAICKSLLARGLQEDICYGILAFENEFGMPVKYGVTEILRFAREKDYFLNYTLVLILGIAPFCLFIKNANYRYFNLKIFSSVFALLFLFSVPLFLLAVDWGRWLSIHFTLLLFTFTQLLKSRPTGSILSSKMPGVEIPKLWNVTSQSSRILNNGIFLLFACSYLTLWSMLHCDRFTLFSLNQYVFVKLPGLFL